ncbi:MAG: hypothetical protein ACXAE3_08190 [Candidatus Kariarchaeaceae archaeon]|jgi:hypothetical protein
MNPRAKFRVIDPASELDSPTVDIGWFDFHPGDLAEEVITTTVLNSLDTDLSTVEVRQGQVIYIRYWSTLRMGVSISMDAILDDFYKIGLDTYNWSNFMVTYHDATPTSWEEVTELLDMDHTDTGIEKIPKEIHRKWFDIALKSGTFEIERGTWDYHYNIANLFGFFPWIIFFAKGGEQTDDHFKFEIEINSEFEIDENSIFKHIDGPLDEQFWILIYNFVLQLDKIEADKRGDTWYRYLQAVHDFTTQSDDYLAKLENMFNYKDLLSIFDPGFLFNYVQTLLLNIAEEPSTPAICNILLEFSTFLLDFQFIDLAKLTEATTLEHALNLDNQATKRGTILELTRRSSQWGSDHLISFIQSLLGLLPEDVAGKSILSDAINEVITQLRKTWDGFLCLVDAKIVADRVDEAIAIRFEATNRIADRETRSGDVFSALSWSLDHDFPAEDRQAIAKSYLIEALEHMHSSTAIEQCEFIIQTCLDRRQLEYLVVFLGFLRGELHRFSYRYQEMLLKNLDELLINTPSSPTVIIEFMLLHLYTLQYIDVPLDPDRPFQIVSNIYNNVNPSLATSEETLQHISDIIIQHALLTKRWSLIEETRRRYLLMAADTEAATHYLKTIFFTNAALRAKLPADQLNVEDIGIKLFNEGMSLVDVATDFEVITTQLPDVKKLAIKSRSYSALADLLLTEVRFKRIRDEDWLFECKEDIDFIARKGEGTDVARVFTNLFTMDLTEEERKELLTFQLELADNEPDLLSSDEIYDKRQELAMLSGDGEMQREFLIENYQQGISELMSKGDTSNLTNLLLDAISYADTNDPLAAEEFKEVLLDNFENISQDVQAQSQPNIYLYLLSVWRRIMETFAATDFEMVVKTTVKLLRLNLHLFQSSKNNQYLRRTQLVLKEMSLVANQHSVKLTEPQMMEFTEVINQLVKSLIRDHQDFGNFAAVFQTAIFYHNVGHTNSFLVHLDRAINDVKQSILIDTGAQSSIFLLLLLLSELNVVLDADLDDDLQVELMARVRRVISFAQSLDLDKEYTEQIKELRRVVNSSEPMTFFHEFPFSLGQYMVTYNIWN